MSSELVPIYAKQRKINDAIDLIQLLPNERAHDRDELFLTIFTIVIPHSNYRLSENLSSVYWMRRITELISTPPLKKEAYQKFVSVLPSNMIGVKEDIWRLMVKEKLMQEAEYHSLLVQASPERASEVLKGNWSKDP